MPEVAKSVRIAIRQLVERGALTDGEAKLLNHPDATDCERHVEPETVGRIEIVPLENATKSDVSCSDGTLEKILDEESLEEIHTYVKACRPRLWEVVEFRFDLRDGEPHSLDETATKFG